MAGIIVYNDVVMPLTIVMAGVAGKNMRLNDRAQNQGGFDSVNVIWQRTLRQFMVGIKPMAIRQWQDLEGLYEVTDAGAYGFLMEDPKDSVVDAGKGFMMPLASGVAVGTVGFGYGVPAYQLSKRYSVTGSTRTKDRKITRLQTAPVFKRGASTLVEGVAAGNISVNRDTGVITFVPDASQVMSSITVGASTVLNFANGTGMVAAMSVGQRTYITGVTGTAASALNGKSHLISAKGSTTLTISTATAGLTAAAGTAYKYPQESETLTGTAKFYVPVHFMDDSIDWQLERSGDYDDRLLSGPSVSLIEIRE